MPQSFSSILVYSQSEIIGDGVWKLPFIATLREAWPGAKLVWATAGTSVYSGLLKPLSGQLLDELISNCEADLRWPRPLLQAPFSGRRFDLVIDTQSHVARTLAVRRTRHGLFISPAADFLFSDKKPARGAPEPETVLARLIRLASLAAGRELARAKVPALPAEWSMAAEALLPNGPTYIGFAPGAGGRNKCWPLENYIELARRVSQKGMVPVLLLGPAEADWVAPLRKSLPGALFPEWDRADAFQHLKGPCLAIALSARLAAGVANNAGPAQIMALGGAPVLALHERRASGIKFRPITERVEILCAEDYGEGLASLPVEAAEAALEILLTPRAIA